LQRAEPVTGAKPEPHWIHSPRDTGAEVLSVSRSTLRLAASRIDAAPPRPHHRRRAHARE
jgi:hypothetical protein